MPSKLVKSSVFSLAAATLGSVLLLAPAAAEDFPIEGSWMQNRACRGDGTDMKALLVTITPHEISYTGGVCNISDKRQDDNKIYLRATCKTRAGKTIAGDVTFTVKDEKTMEMVDRDKSYNAVLNRCP